MERYDTIESRIEQYRRMRDADDIRIEYDDEKKNSDNLIPTVAQNRTLDEPVRIMISMYDPNGIETAYYGKARYRFYHDIPFTGVLHKHEFIEIFYVIDGYFEQILLGEKHHFEAGEFVITDQNCEHSDYLVSVDAAVIFIMIRADYMDELLHWNDERDELYRFLFHALSRQKKEQSFLRLQEMNEGREKTSYILERLFEEVIEKDVGYREISKGLLIRLLQHMCMNYRPILKTDTQESKEKALLYEIERFIRVNYATVTSAVLEKHFHYHRNYYNHLLQKYRGVSFKNYVLDIRLRKAEELLRTTTLPINQIIRMIGYENTSHFYHLYEEKYGHAPRHREEA